MKTVYVAGVYSDDNVIGVLRNIGKGQYWCQKVFKAGMAPFCPWHDRTFVIDNWREELDVHLFYEFSLAWLRKSDVMFVTPDFKGMKQTKDSTGIALEIEEANRLGIPIVYSWDKLMEWKSLNQ